MKHWMLFMPVAGLLLFGCAASKAPGITDGNLAPCPNSPNCVISDSTADDKHRMEALTFSGDPKAAMELLISIIQDMPRTQVVTQTPNYIHAVFSSRLFRFKDDVEFLLADDKKSIMFRSASRLGYSDLGANRKRMETIGRSFADKMSKE